MEVIRAERLPRGVRGVVPSMQLVKVVRSSSSHLFFLTSFITFSNFGYSLSYRCTDDILRYGKSYRYLVPHSPEGLNVF